MQITSHDDEMSHFICIVNSFCIKLKDNYPPVSEWVSEELEGVQMWI